MDGKADLTRFVKAQELSYQTALWEIQGGCKRSHWMWYIFPQICGLGRSSTSQYYAIRDLNEAIDYLQDPFLGQNLNEICEALLELKTDDPRAVFGRPDDMKLRSSMTLFALVSGRDSIFHKVLEKFFNSLYDERTIRIATGR